MSVLLCFRLQNNYDRDGNYFRPCYAKEDLSLSGIEQNGINFLERRRKYGTKKTAQYDKFVSGGCLIDWFRAGSIPISVGGANATE